MRAPHEYRNDPVERDAREGMRDQPRYECADRCIAASPKRNGEQQQQRQTRRPQKTPHRVPDVAQDGKQAQSDLQLEARRRATCFLRVCRTVRRPRVTIPRRRCPRADTPAVALPMSLAEYRDADCHAFHGPRHFHGPPTPLAERRWNRRLHFALPQQPRLGGTRAGKCGAWPARSTARAPDLLPPAARCPRVCTAPLKRCRW